MDIKILICEDAEGNYVPIACIFTVAEGKEIAVNDMKARMAAVESGKSPFCPENYFIWMRGATGDYIKCVLPE
jgi:hypothetical protein